MTGLGGTRQDVTRRAARYGAFPVVALGATVALATGETQSLSQAVHGIQGQFHLSDRVVGFLPFAMAIVGVFGAMPFGLLADRRRRTTLVTFAMLVWTVCMGLTGLAPTFLLVFLFRMGVGAVEANGPASLSLLADYYPVRERAKRLSLSSSGALIGAMVGLLGGGLAVSWGGWRWAFLMWVPIGLAVAAVVARLPEPERGAQDADFEAEMRAASEAAESAELAQLAAAADAAKAASAGVMADATGAAEVASRSGLLPKPRRVGTLDYDTCTLRDVAREMLRVPTLWFGMFAITVSQLLLNALQFWGVEYYKRVHHLGAAAAGGVTALFGMGAVIGILGGGFLSDRYLRRGVINARVYVVVAGSIAATVVLMPAFASTNLALAAPLMFLGGIFLTLPVAPADAMVADVTPAGLRGRAYSLRSIVRALSSFGPVVVGLASSALADGGFSRGDALRWALVGLTPVYAIGGLVMLFCVRTYPADMAFALAESRRTSAVGLAAPEPVR